MSKGAHLHQPARGIEPGSRTPDGWVLPKAGHECDDPHGYVSLRGDVMPFIAFFIERARLLEKRWEKMHRHVRKGCRSMSLQMEIDGSGGPLLVLPDQPPD